MRGGREFKVPSVLCTYFGKFFFGVVVHRLDAPHAPWSGVRGSVEGWVLERKREGEEGVWRKRGVFLSYRKQPGRR